MSHFYLNHIHHINCFTKNSYKIEQLDFFTTTALTASSITGVQSFNLAEHSINDFAFIFDFIFLPSLVVTNLSDPSIRKSDLVPAKITFL